MVENIEKQTVYVLVEVYQAIVNDVVVFEEEAAAEEEFQKLTGMNWYDYEAKMQDRQVDYDADMLLGDHAGTTIYICDVVKKSEEPPGEVAAKAPVLTPQQKFEALKTLGKID